MKTLFEKIKKDTSFIIIVITAFMLLLTVPSGFAKPIENEKILNTEINWYALLISDKKSGYMKHERIELEKSIQYRVSLYMEINRSGTIISSMQVDETYETKNGKPIGFKKTESAMGEFQSVEGTILANGKWKIVSTTGSKVTEKTIEWPSGSVMNEGFRILSLKKGLKEGTIYTISEFSLNSFTAVKNTIKIGKTVPVKMISGEAKLVEITNSVIMGSTHMEIKSYVDSSYLLKKMIFDFLGSKMEFVHCTEKYALSPNEKNDLLASLRLYSPFKLKNSDFNKKIQYKLKINSNFQLKDIPYSAEQKIVEINQDEKYITIYVKNIKKIEGGSCSYNGNDKKILSALKPSSYVQSNDEKIKTLAKKIVGNCTDPYLASKKIESFVRKYINKKNLNVGYASALEVLKNREGDCSEHAVLTTALCKAIGIPANVAIGFVYVLDGSGDKNTFVPHAWTIIYIDGKWISIDAAMGSYGSGHILIDIGNGDPHNFLNMMNLLGYIQIIEMDISEK